MYAIKHLIWCSLIDAVTRLYYKEKYCDAESSVPDNYILLMHCH